MKLEKLTLEQELLLSQTREEWIDLALKSGKDLTFDEIKDSVYWIYEKSKLQKPFIILMDNPYHVQIACNYIKWKYCKGSQVDSQVYSRVGSQVRSQQLEWFDRYGGLGYWSGYFAWVDYYQKIGIVQGEDITKWVTFFKLGVWEVVFLDGFCVISKLPLKVLRDDRNRLHSTSQPAIQWRGGKTEYHYIHGVYFEKDLWLKVTDRKLSPKQLLELKNTDQRFVALNHYGFEKALNELKPKLIDKSKKGNKLYKIKFENIEIKFLLYPDTVSGNPRVSFVKPEFEDADQAMAWKHHLTKSEYLALEIEA